MTERLRAAAQALVARWDSPQWGGSAEHLRHTGEHIAELRAALAEQPALTATYTCGVCGVSMQMEQPAEQEPQWPETLAEALYRYGTDFMCHSASRGIDDIEEAGCLMVQASKKLAEQVPCGWQFFQDGRWHNGSDLHDHRKHTEAAGVQTRDVYPAPQPAKRVPLTDEEIAALWLDNISGPLTASKFARAIEKAHGITGETK